MGQGAWWAAWGLIALLLVLPFAGAAVSTVTIDAGVEYQSRAGGGLITFTDAYTPTSVSIADNYLYLGAPAAGYTTLGIDAPVAADLSVTDISQWQITYSTTQALVAKTERVYTPGRTEPTVTGAGSSTYAGSTSTIITNMNDNVALKWEQTISYGTTSGASLLISFLPLLLVLAVVGAYKQPEHWQIIIGTALVAGVLLLLGQTFLGWGY